MATLQTDITTLVEGARLRLHPVAGNPLHSKPATGDYAGGYFYLDRPIGKPEDGPDYYVGDVLQHCEGWEVLS
ncbi:MAG: hypothetical protein JKP96_06515 [Oceanicaulis sp.]|jgi:hypothetical protein|nr:hypothetical protein [Oceanicaulis sp.]